MLPKKMLEVLACPKCRGHLTEKENHLECQRCHARYPIEDGIPVFTKK